MINFFESHQIQISSVVSAGDISFADAASSSAVLEELKHGEIETQIELLEDMRDTEIDMWALEPGQRETHDALRQLTEDWDYAVQGEFYEQEVAQIGAFSTLAYIRRSELIPVEFKDLSHELDDMSKFDGETIVKFAPESWSNLGNTHPLLFNELLSFVMHLESAYGIKKRDDSVRMLLGASAVLPYLMANTSIMLGELDEQLKDEELYIK